MKLAPTTTKKASRIFTLMLARKDLILVLICEIVTNSPLGEDELRL